MSYVYGNDVIFTLFWLNTISIVLHFVVFMVINNRYKKKKKSDEGTTFFLKGFRYIGIGLIPHALLLFIFMFLIGWDMDHFFDSFYIYIFKGSFTSLYISILIMYCIFDKNGMYKEMIRFASDNWKFKGIPVFYGLSIMIVAFFLPVYSWDTMVTLHVVQICFFLLPIGVIFAVSPFFYMLIKIPSKEIKLRSFIGMFGLVLYALSPMWAMGMIHPFVTTDVLLIGFYITPFIYLISFAMLSVSVK